MCVIDACGSACMCVGRRYCMSSKVCCIDILNKKEGFDALEMEVGGC